MSQKTNPTSLRLHKNNQNFSLQWFSDFFFTENYHYGYQIEKALESFLKQAQYSKAFFSARNQYRNFSIFLFLQDYRADKKEKQLFFKLKSSSQSKTLKDLSKTAVFQLLHNNPNSNLSQISSKAVCKAPLTKQSFVPKRKRNQVLEKLTDSHDLREKALLCKQSVQNKAFKLDSNQETLWKDLLENNILQEKKTLLQDFPYFLSSKETFHKRNLLSCLFLTFFNSPEEAKKYCQQSCNFATTNSFIKPLMSFTTRLPFSGFSLSHKTEISKVDEKNVTNQIEELALNKNSLLSDFRESFLASFLKIKEQIVRQNTVFFIEKTTPLKSFLIREELAKQSFATLLQTSCFDRHDFFLNEFLSPEATSFAESLFVSSAERSKAGICNDVAFSIKQKNLLSAEKKDSATSKLLNFNSFFLDKLKQSEKRQALLMVSCLEMKDLSQLKKMFDSADFDSIEKQVGKPLLQDNFLKRLLKYVLLKSAVCSRLWRSNAELCMRKPKIFSNKITSKKARSFEKSKVRSALHLISSESLSGLLLPSITQSINYRYIFEAQLKNQLRKKKSCSAKLYKTKFCNCFATRLKIKEFKEKATEAFPCKACNTKQSFVTATLKSFLQTKKLCFAKHESKQNFTTPFLTTTINIQPIRFIKDDQNALTWLNQIVMLIEKRVAFRQIKSFLDKELAVLGENNSQLKGIRLSCSGRLGGRSKKAQKAKVQSASWGQTSLSAFSSKLLFGSKNAYTSYGQVGIKLWLCLKNHRC